jgi:hypothetical protein
VDIGKEYLDPEKKQGDRRLIKSLEAMFRKPWWIM